jgi:hypothetical protein
VTVLRTELASIRNVETLVLVLADKTLTVKLSTIYHHALASSGSLAIHSHSATELLSQKVRRANFNDDANLLILFQHRLHKILANLALAAPTVSVGKLTDKQYARVCRISSEALQDADPNALSVRSVLLLKPASIKNVSILALGLAV